MKFAGSVATACLWLLIAVLPATMSHARITAEVDRNDVALGETLRLTLRADAGEQPDELDLSSLERDFDILQRSSATSARIVGGEQSVTRTLELDLAPRREGLATIPSFIYDGRRTTPIAVKVSPEPVAADNDALVLFDAKVDRTEAYVQAQVILTVTLQQAINLDNRAVSELEIPNTYVEQLEQRSFQRRQAGRLWQVTELRYALFPQQSGSIEIPSLAFSGRELLPGRSLLGARLGRRISIQSDPISVRVKPVPASFTGDVWLPARSLSLTSRWSAEPDSLNVGDSTTRTLEMTAEGLQGSQLPPLKSIDQRDLKGLRFYPDQETVEQQEVSTGIAGYRLQSEALVATESGQWVLPAQEIPWWNTETDTMEIARLPAVTVAVTGSAPVPSDGLTPDSAIPTVNDAGGSTAANWLWPSIAALGWLVAATLAWVLWQRSDSQPKRSTSTSSHFRVGNRELIPLRLACSQNDPSAARDALLAWGKSYLGQRGGSLTLDGLALEVDASLRAEIGTLDRALYSAQAGSWQGESLFAAVRAQTDKGSNAEQPDLELYPAT